MPRGDARNFKGKNKGTPGNKGRGSAEDRKIAALFRKFAQKVVTDKVVQATILEKAQTGTLHPSIMNSMFNYGAGKPPDAEATPVTVVPVRVEHVYADDSDPK